MTRRGPARRIGAIVAAAACSLLLLGLAVSSFRSVGFAGSRIQTVISHGALTVLISRTDAKFRQSGISAPRRRSMLWQPDYAISPTTLLFTLPLWLPAAFLGAAAAWLWHASRPPPPWRCPSCGYDRRGLSGPVCPECGHPGNRV